MARRKQKGAAFGKRAGSNSQEVQQNRSRQKTITYSGIGLASLLGLCFVVYLVFRVPQADYDAFVEEPEAVTDGTNADELSSMATDSLEAEIDALISDDDNNPVLSEKADDGIVDDTTIAAEDTSEESTIIDGDPSPTNFVLLESERAMAEKSPAERANAYDESPEMIIDTANTYEAVIVTANGEMRLRLFDDEAPLTVNNFVSLAQDGFYDGTVFHRVLADFMAQGGDPTGTGTGGPGYRFEDEVDNELALDRRGLLAMANSGRGTNGSQFFITFVETPWLTGNHTIFGELIEGDDVLGSITIRDPRSAIDPDVLERVDIYVSEG